jgi:hypothetical protein
MSDAEAQAQSSELAEKTSTTEATVSEITTEQDGPLTGSDEAIGKITDIDSYRSLVNSIQSSSSEQEEEAIEETKEGAASEGNPDEKDGQDGLGQKGSETAKGKENAESQGEEEEVRDESGKKPPQYRWRPKSEVDALAMDIIKRAEKSGKEISMKEALAQAETILKKDDSDDSEVSNNIFPETVEEAQAYLADLRAQRKQAFAKDLDFEKAAELDEQIEAVKDHIGNLKQAEVLTRQNQEAKWNQVLETSKAKAVELYPDVTNPESELVQKMVEIDGLLKETGNDLFYAPEKPLKLAQMAANELGIAPKIARATKVTSKPTASSQPAKATASAAIRPVQPASGTARTTQQTNNLNGQFAVELDKVTDEESWREAMNKLKVVAA